MELSVWRIHRRIGMSGGLFANGLLRNTGREFEPGEAARLQDLHAHFYEEQFDQVRAEALRTQRPHGAAVDGGEQAEPGWR
jgi:hypothetical protein